MSVYEEIDEMSNRLSQGERRQIKERIKLYSEGVKAKLKNAEYALSKINELSPQNDNMTTSETPDFCVFDKIHFYVDSFFAFLYSTFDIISHVINQKYHLGLEEKDVSFNKVKQSLNNSCHGLNIQRIFDRLSSKIYFKNLDRYRNCSTHRRQIYIETLTISGTRGYSTTADVPEVFRVICDNPLSLHPRMNQSRILKDYCDDIFAKVNTEITDISNKI